MQASFFAGDDDLQVMSGLEDLIHQHIQEHIPIQMLRGLVVIC